MIFSHCETVEYFQNVNFTKAAGVGMRTGDCRCQQLAKSGLHKKMCWSTSETGNFPFSQFQFQSLNLLLNNL